MSIGDVEYAVEWSPHMETIQVVLDSKLLQATDRAARRGKLNRSALIREAIRAHLKRLEIRELEERDRKGYEVLPPDRTEMGRREVELA
jgi:metal-responsive CopG/Arc/MetJ family transcriptional regulator